MRTQPLLLALAIGAAFGTAAGAAPTPPMTPDIPTKFDPPRAMDYERREVMIPMRDGVKLHTVLLIPKGARRAPIVLSRTPYNASKRAERQPSNQLAVTTSIADDQLIAGGYIRAYQDIRGKYGSEGDYVMTRPLRGPLNTTPVDHSTDAYDTIDWLVKNVRETNGKVGMIGSSYEGFTVLMALVRPHPALKAAVPMCPMVDGWKGDDWFHWGAFRQINLGYFVGQTSARGEGKNLVPTGYDDYEAFRRAGSVGDYARARGIDQLPYWAKLTEHPTWDAYWQAQALDKLLAAEPLIVPTMIVASLWDQEDIYGAVHTYQALEPKDTRGDKLFLVLGPWRHSGINARGASLGPLDFDGDTALAFRRDLMRPFLDQRLKDAAPAASTAAATVYETGTNTWRRLPAWPVSCAKGCAAPSTKLYLQPGFAAGWKPPAADAAEADDYVSDPAKPVPYVPRPVRFDDSELWQRWLLSDQRAVADRPDVLVYTSEPLTAPLRLAGAPQVHLAASTTGTDADWVVKLIDVYPEEMPGKPELGGYQLPIAMDIFRGRYRTGLDRPTAIPANQVQTYEFPLPHVSHVIQPGHRIMVQIQSSWFPLYDRNPQTFVENIFFAKPGDYKKATHRVFHRGAQASYLELPTAPLAR